MTPVQVKICGLTRRPDAEQAAASGAHYGGVILAPGGRRSITADAAARIFADLPLRRVGVFVDAGETELLHAAETAALDAVQLHGSESPQQAERLREEGKWEVWKAIRPRDASEFLDELRRFAGAVDGILLDGWSAAAPGGTGASFPWELVARHRSEIPETLRLIIAGGLSAANVARVVEILRPQVVDVSSGVETSPGVKDAAEISAFVTAAHGVATDPFLRS